MLLFQIFENGEKIWSGQACDVDHALDRCYYHESIPVGMKIRVEVKTTKGWREAYSVTGKLA